MWRRRNCVWANQRGLHLCLFWVVFWRKAKRKVTSNLDVTSRRIHPATRLQSFELWFEPDICRTLKLCGVLCQRNHVPEKDPARAPFSLGAKYFLRMLHKSQSLLSPATLALDTTAWRDVIQCNSWVLTIWAMPFTSRDQYYTELEPED